MGTEHRGRGGLPADMIEHALRLLAREEQLTNQVVAERVGCSVEIVRQLRLGIHRSQKDVDRRGNKPERVRLAMELLARDPPLTITRIANILGMHRSAIRAMRDGQYITQRDMRFQQLRSRDPRISLD